MNFLLFRSSRKRKLQETADHESITTYTDENMSALPSGQPVHSVPLLDSCPDHITEVEISSQETMDATKSIAFEDSTSIRIVEDSTMDPSERTAELHQVTVEDSSMNPVERTTELQQATDVAVVTESVSSKQSLTSQEVKSTDPIDTDHHSEILSVRTGLESSVVDSQSPHQAIQDQEQCLEEPQSEINASTVVENLNLIAQAMEARMLESSNASSSNSSNSEPSSCKNNINTVVTERSSQNSPGDSKRRVSARCRSLLGQVKQLTGIVQDTSVLETVQDKLLDIVSFMENHIPLTQEQKDSLVHSEVIQLADAETVDSAPEVMNIEEVQVVDSVNVNFEVVIKEMSDQQGSN